LDVFRFATWIAVLMAVMVCGAAAADPASMFAKRTPGSAAAVDHSAWSKLLSQYVVASTDGINRVRYARFKREGHAALKGYITALEGADVAALDAPEQMAFWINLYNAKTIDIVLDAYPVASIKDIKLGGSFAAAFTGGPWKAEVVTVSGVGLSLDDIEHSILRGQFHDPRVHYAVNCASLGCPNLQPEAWSGRTLNARLDQAAAAYINHHRGFAASNGTVTASSIYKWFAEDFGGADGSVLAHAKRYAAPVLKRELESITTISGYGYDWALNDAGGG
jgi:hypothetical protein